MTIERFNPPELASPAMNLYAQAVVCDATRLVFIAGQVALNAVGQVVGAGDYAVQAHQAFSNLKSACVGAGAEAGNIVQMSIYVVNHRPDLIIPIFDAGRAVFGEGWPLCASKLIGVAALGMPDWLVEIDAIAARTN